MPYQVTQYLNANIFIIGFRNTLDEIMLDKAVNEALNNLRNLNDAACLILDVKAATIADLAAVSEGFRLVDHLLPTKLVKTPLFLALVDQPDSELGEALFRERIGIPVFPSLEEAVSYARLKIDGNYLRQNLADGHTENLGKSETLTILQQPNPEMAYAADPTSTLPEGCVIELMHIESNRNMLLIPKTEITIGRRDQKRGRPDIDLTMWNAAQRGVSRQHAQFVMTPARELLVMDMGSSNGTYLNGKMLEPQIKYPVSHGDKIKLGAMELLIHFKVPTEEGKNQ